MKIFSVSERQKESFVIALGRFDGLHVGHQKVISAAKTLSSSLGSPLAMFTFRHKKNAFSSVFSFEETVAIAQTMNVDAIIYADETPSFFSIDKDDFLSLLTNNFSLKALAFGDDYTFGKGRAGSADHLALYCKSRGVAFARVPLEYVDGEKVSSTAIKESLVAGDVKRANALLGREYFITGTIVHGRGVGKTLGFPTANVVPGDSKLRIKQGVYVTESLICGKRYRSITNVGAAPTFKSGFYLVESFVKGFDREVYGEEITVYFQDFLRETIKFDSVESLKEQIEKDKMSL